MDVKYNSLVPPSLFVIFQEMMLARPLLLLALLPALLVQGLIYCYVGQVEQSGVLNVTAKNCSANYDECVSCFEPKGSGGGLSKYDHEAFFCGSDSFVSLVEALGAKDCQTCSTDLCNGSALGKLPLFGLASLLLALYSLRINLLY